MIHRISLFCAAGLFSIACTLPEPQATATPTSEAVSVEDFTSGTTLTVQVCCEPFIGHTVAAAASFKLGEDLVASSEATASCEAGESGAAVSVTLAADQLSACEQESEPPLKAAVSCAFTELDSEDTQTTQDELDFCVEGADEDGDGYRRLDCDDANAASYPGAEEVCDGVDNDCDGDIDEAGAADPVDWYADADGDGYGADDEVVTACDAPSGYVAAGGDCDDDDPAYHPGADESDCTDPNDYDCDGSVGYADADGDGFAACEECDDTNADVNPGAAELCTPAGAPAIDEDCDGELDEDAVDATTWYADYDGDGYGADDEVLTACVNPDDYLYTERGGDCDDWDYDYHPGAPEDDCADPNDYNCDGSTGYDDADKDGWYACEDCDDSDAAVYPYTKEIENGADDDCDGEIDEGP